MRFIRIASLALLALSFAAPAHAQSGSQTSQMRVFDNFNCPQTFPCLQTEPSALSSIANSCASGDMGVPASFDGVSLDSDNCMSTTVGSKDGHMSQARCCVVSTGAQNESGGNDCRMRCFFMAN